MWSVFTRVGVRRRNTFSYDHTTWTKPMSANFLASVVLQGFRFWLNSYSPVHLNIPSSESETGMPLPDILARWVADPRYLLDKVQVPNDAGVRLASGIIQGTARAVSDGSYKQGIVGTAACGLAADDQDKDCLKALNTVPGWADDQSPYRSELTGILGSLTLVLAVCYSFDIQDGSVTLALDGEAAMKQAMAQADKNTPLKVSQKHFDLLQVCRSLIRMLPVRIQWRWVESHQRENGVVNLDWWAKMNDWCDHNAKLFGKHCRLHPMVPRTKLFGETVAIEVDGHKLSHTSVDDLYCRTFGKKTLAYWRKRSEHTQEAQNQVQWEVAARARNALPSGLYSWHAKYVSGHLPTSQLLLKRQHQDHAECPRCNEAPETQLHVLRCPAPSATSKWTEGMNNLRACLSKEVTHPGLAAAISTILSLWQKGATIQVSLLPGGPRVRHAANLQQSLLGWNSFVSGQWHWAWQELQANYLQSIGSRRAGKRWATAIIRQFFLIAWDMWLHRNHIRHIPGGQRDRDRGRETDPLIRGYFYDGIASLHVNDHHLLTDHSCDTVLGWPYEEKRKWLQSVALAKEFKEQEPDLATYRTPADLRRQQQFMVNWLNSANP